MWTQKQLQRSLERIGCVLPAVRYRGQIIDGARRAALGCPVVEVTRELDAATWLAVSDPTRLHTLQSTLARADLPQLYRQVAAWRAITRRRVMAWGKRVAEGGEPDLAELEALL